MTESKPQRKCIRLYNPEGQLQAVLDLGAPKIGPGLRLSPHHSALSSLACSPLQRGFLHVVPPWPPEAPNPRGPDCS